jgi:hypothetical protein
MGENTHDHPAATPAPAPRRTWHRQFVMWASGLGIGWIVSILIHGGLIGTAIVYKPFRDAIFEPQRREEVVQASSETVQEVSEFIKDENEEALKETVEALQQIEHVLEDLREEKMQEYTTFEAELTAESPARALEAQQAAIEAQKQVEDLIAEQKHGEALKKQAEADAHQDQARRSLEMLGPVAEKEQAGQDAAIARQAEANATELEARKAAEAAHSANESAKRAAEEAAKSQAAVEAREKEATESAAAVENRRKDAEAKRAEATQQSAEAKESAQKRDAAKGQFEQARKSKEAALKSTAPAKEQAFKQAEAAAKSQADEAKRAGEEANRAERELKNAQTRHAKDQGELAKARTKAEEAAAKAAATKQAAEEAAAAQQAATEAAKSAQADARKEQEKAHENLKKSISDGLKPAEPSQVADAESSTPYESTAGKNLAELYDQAKRTEAQITETYRELRAAELAMIRKVGLEEAKAQTDVPAPVRPELNEQLLTGAARDPGKLDEQKKEIATALRESQSMVALGGQLLNTAMAGKRAELEGMTADGAIANAAGAEQLALVTDNGQGAQDLTTLTGGKPAANSSQGAGQAAGNASDGRIGLPGGSFPPSIDPKQMGKVVPARRIATGADGADLAYIDSWYVIGPFDNPGRKNINQVFPPESVIDLDAVYVGMGGKPLRWEFTQSNTPMLTPVDVRSYAIYYAYTEIYSDQPRDLWIAVGSDDYSKIWLNGTLIYASGQGHKPWRITETWKKVHFRQGVNRILYRVENGWQGMGWSMVLALKK